MCDADVLTALHHFPYYISTNFSEKSQNVSSPASPEGGNYSGHLLFFREGGGELLGGGNYSGGGELFGGGFTHFWCLVID